MLNQHDNYSNKVSSMNMVRVSMLEIVENNNETFWCCIMMRQCEMIFFTK